VSSMSHGKIIGKEGALTWRSLRHFIQAANQGASKQEQGRESHGRTSCDRPVRWASIRWTLLQHHRDGERRGRSSRWANKTRRRPGSGSDRHVLLWFIELICGPRFLPPHGPCPSFAFAAFLRALSPPLVIQSIIQSVYQSIAPSSLSFFLIRAMNNPLVSPKRGSNTNVPGKLPHRHGNRPGPAPCPPSFPPSPSSFSASEEKKGSPSSIIGSRTAFPPSASSK